MSMLSTRISRGDLGELLSAAIEAQLLAQLILAVLFLRLREVLVAFLAVKHLVFLPELARVTGTVYSARSSQSGLRQCRLSKRCATSRARMMILPA